MGIGIVNIYKTPLFSLWFLAHTLKWHIFATIFFMMMTLVFCTTSCESEEDKKRNAIYNDSLMMIDDCKNMDNATIKIYGKVMLFDYDQSEVKLFDYYRRYMYCMAYLEDLAASPYDNEITVFIISTKKLNLVGYYEPGRGEAYRASFTIYVINWSQKKPLGMHTILSNPPKAVKSSGAGRLGDVTGDVYDIVKWILSLPRS